MPFVPWLETFMLVSFLFSVQDVYSCYELLFIVSSSSSENRARTDFLTFLSALIMFLY